VPANGREAAMLRHRTKNSAPVDDSAPDVYPVDGDNGVDAHSLHVTDATCVRCNRAIGENDETRRKADGNYVHLCC
jgi:hypothetical protein